MSRLLFSKPLLVFDFESTGMIYEDNGDVIDKGDPSQLGAVLLDPKTLEARSEFATDIRVEPSLLTQWVLENTDITPERAKAAPAPRQVAQKFVDQFGTEVFLASWNVDYDRHWLSKLLASINRNDSMYDYHHIDVWTLAYSHLAALGKGDIIRSEEVFTEFGQSARNMHNALDDAKRTAAVLRAVLLGEKV